MTSAALLRLHGGHHGVQVGNVHQHRHLGGVLRVDEGADVGDAEGSEELLAFRRGQPMLGVLNVVVTDHGGHWAPDVVARWRALVRSSEHGPTGLASPVSAGHTLCMSRHGAGSAGCDRTATGALLTVTTRQGR